ncbi:MAG: ABC transporter ATP-binding protein [Phycisphaerae bacterium]|jgi:ABC-type polysaccharide/polyol phosphate transport system ATPase subunit
MKENIAIKVEGLSKAYKLYDMPIDRLKESIHIFRKKYHRDFYALRDVSFEVRKGECLGIIGKNGCGKSTLLKIITGVLSPTSGHVETTGKVSALLELGIGFNPEMTGIENVYFNGALMGSDKKDIDRKINDIISFADIGEFIHQPLKTYSTGMFMRLAFAAAINVDPDILIIDEALAVGDIRFQQKCFRKIREFGENGKTIIFVSHDMGAIVNLCNRVMWLKDNLIYRCGNPEEVISEYVLYMTYDSVARKREMDKKNERIIENADMLSGKELSWQDVMGCSSFGEGGAEIKRVALCLNKSRKNVNVLQGGEDVVFALDVVVKSDIHFPIIGLGLKDKYGNDLLGINTYIYKTEVQPLLKDERIIVEISFKFPMFKNGDYTICAGIAEGTQETHLQHHWIYDAYIVKVLNTDFKHTRGGSLLISENVNIEISKNSIDG